MKIYTVHAAPGGNGTEAADLNRFVFIKDGFSWPAFLIAEPWLLFRRMWLVFLIYLGAMLVVVMAARPSDGPLAAAILMLARLYFAFEANGLRRWSLERGGYRFIGLAEGGGLGEAEYRFFSSWLAAGAKPPETSAPSPAAQAGPPPTGHVAGAGEVVGLFPAPGGRS